MHISSLVCGVFALVVALVILVIYYMQLDTMYIEIVGWLLGVGGAVMVGTALASRSSHGSSPSDVDGAEWWKEK